MRSPTLKTQSYKTGGTLRRMALCLVLCALILCAAAIIRQRLGLSQPFSLSPQATSAPQTPPPDTSHTSLDISLSGRSWYALQLGAFTQENAAHQLSQEFIPRGAAGYVCQEDDIYRVYAAAYPTRAEAQSVQTRLNEQGVATYIQPCNEESLTLRAEGTKTQLQAVSDIFSYLDALSMKFFTLSSQLDKGEITAADAISALMSESTTCRALSSTLQDSFSGALPAGALPLHDLLRLIAEECESAQNSQSAARAGAALKRCQLSVTVGLKHLFSQL